MRRYLFVCGKNRLRSPTAEQIFAQVPGVETLSAGVNHDADEQLSDELVGWADVIFVMEQAHRRKLQTRHRKALAGKRVVVLDIPDNYAFMEPRLIASLEAKMRPWLPDTHEKPRPALEEGRTGSEKAPPSVGGDGGSKARR